MSKFFKDYKKLHEPVGRVQFVHEVKIGSQIWHCVNNFLSFYSIILKLGTQKELVIP